MCVCTRLLRRPQGVCGYVCVSLRVCLPALNLIPDYDPDPGPDPDRDPDPDPGPGPDNAYHE